MHKFYVTRWNVIIAEHLITLINLVEIILGHSQSESNTLIIKGIIQLCF